ncbi:MAG: M16 family metallopeptidase [Fibrobacterota bacterium]
MALKTITLLFLALSVFGEIPEHPSKLEFKEKEFTPPLLSDFTEDLPGGAKLVTVKDTRLPVVDITVHISVPLAINKPEEITASKFAVNLMRTGGTEKFKSSEFDKRAEFIAASIGASPGLTEQSFSLSVLKKNFKEGFSLFLSMIKEPAFEKKQMEILKGRYCQAVRNRFESPAATAETAFDLLLYNNHPRGHMTDSAEISGITAETLRKYHKRLMTPSRMVIQVSGDTEGLEIEKDFKKFINELPEPLPEPEAAALFNTFSGKFPPGVYIVDFDINQARIKMGHFALQRPHPDYYELGLMNYILGGGTFSSRLMSTIRNKNGLAYSVGSRVESSYFYKGAFSVHCQTKNSTASKAVNLALSEINNIINEKVSSEELEKAVSDRLQSYPSMFATAEKKASAVALSLLWNRDDDHFRQYPEKLKALTVTDIKEAASKYLKPESMRIVICGKKEDIFGEEKVNFPGEIKIFTTEDLEKIK